MNISGINFESVVDGEGVRVVVFVSGCAHDCKGCHNPSQHSFTAGRPFTTEFGDEIIEYLKKTSFVSGVTLSGGDPMYSAVELIPFIVKLKDQLAEKSIWIYSGFTFEEIMLNDEMAELIALCDVLVDGEFILEQRDMTLSYKGSRNQRIIDIPKQLQSGNPVLWENE